MPVYLCQPGKKKGQVLSEPWRHYLQVYATPFEMDVGTANNNNSATTTGQGNTTTTTAITAADDENSSHVDISSTMAVAGSVATNSNNTVGGSNSVSGNSVDHPSAAANSTLEGFGGGGTRMPVRKIRYSEIVLVDDICIAYGRYWLRLRWPGRRHGGFAGYLALGQVVNNDGRPKQLALEEGSASSTAAVSGSLPGVATSMSREQAIAAAMSSTSTQAHHETPHQSDDTSSNNAVALSTGRTVFETDQREGNDEDLTRVDSGRDDEPQDNASTLSAEPLEASSPVTDLVCSRNGIVFPSNVALKLLKMYDDGFATQVVPAPQPSESVFCRICREGIHEDADDEQPTPAVENDADESGGLHRGRSGSPSGSLDNLDDGIDNNVDRGSSDNYDDDEREPMESDPVDPILSKGPILPHPTYHANHNALDNPMMSPCECSGSMAFVHRMCIEQWRCRSRHPEARQGLNCETCGKPYALKAPASRPAAHVPADNDDWLEAMPPHVLEALRRPHIWWQVGAAVVRRRWLRPIAPVIMSPIVALYCRARRMLKKKVWPGGVGLVASVEDALGGSVSGVYGATTARGNARTYRGILFTSMCVTNLAGGAWSLVFYGALALLAFPGSLRDPMMYDLGLAAIPVAFYLTAVIGGGIATAMKKGAGIDMRGRAFESEVVIATIFLVFVLWGLIGGFFGRTSKCYGALTNYVGPSDLDSVQSSFVLQTIHRFVLLPAQNWFHGWDNVASNTPTRIRRVLCMPDQEEGCFEYSYRADASFIEEELKCASDMVLVSGVVTSAIVIGSVSYLWKQHERQRRAARRARPHQD
eukprot:CAMPEP_0113483100 /NCGR_PEP_ID=MMETSP0014_2-20120614/23260_1 /TAXON_ID=2857 /ORGANISM="Nitzschia sp." /LENGTH=816 /DNA_ID=CAMNT_0000376637 /DNA_START=280 /DNA_END=2730 /DNA_ORIENTATION=- /assembly_acc=CAM_ASM_000159